MKSKSTRHSTRTESTRLTQSLTHGKQRMKEEYKPDTNEVVNEWLEMYEKYMGKGGEKKNEPI